MARPGYFSTLTVVNTAAISEITVALTLDSTLTALGVVTIETNGGQLVLQNSGAAVRAADQQFRGGGTDGGYNWKIGKDLTVNDTWQIAPSTAANGSTYTTPVQTWYRTGGTTTGAGADPGAGNLAIVGAGSASTLIIGKDTVAANSSGLRLLTGSGQYAFELGAQTLTGIRSR